MFSLSKVYTIDSILIKSGLLIKKLFVCLYNHCTQIMMLFKFYIIVLFVWRLKESHPLYKELSSFIVDHQKIKIKSSVTQKHEFLRFLYFPLVSEILILDLNKSCYLLEQTHKYAMLLPLLKILVIRNCTTNHDDHQEDLRS